MHPYHGIGDDQSPSTAAERMRPHRKRQWHGLQHVRILLHARLFTWALERDQRTDADALQAAVSDLVYRAMERDV